MAEKGLEITARAESVSANAEAVNQFPTQLFLLNNANHELSMRSPWKVKTSYGYVLSFAQASAPTAEHIGDLWFDTDDDNHLYRWSGSAWTSVRDSRFEDVLTNIFSPISSSTWQDQLIVSAPPFSPVPWNRDFIAFLAPPIKTGTATSVYGFQLVDSGANFGAVPVPVGSIVRNTSTGLTARVLPNVGTTAMWLNYHIFPATAGYEVYAPPVLPDQFIELTGAKIDGDGAQHANSDTANHLINSTGTVWTGVVSVNDWAWNLSSGRCAQVKNVAAHDLTLMWDCFPNGNEPYLIFANWITINCEGSPMNGRMVQEMNVSGRYVGGRLSAGNVEEDTGQIHIHTPVVGSEIEINGTAGSTDHDTTTTGDKNASWTTIGNPSASHGYGTYRGAERTQPRTLGQVYIMRIK